MRIRGEGLADEQGGGLEEEKIIYVMHPNCVVEEIGGEERRS